MTPPPFFIVACDRSGTTMLRLILDGSPDVAIPTESMVLVDFAARAGDPLETDAEFDRLARAVWRHPNVVIAAEGTVRRNPACSGRVITVWA